MFDRDFYCYEHLLLLSRYMYDHACRVRLAFDLGAHWGIRTPDGATASTKAGGNEVRG